MALVVVCEWQIERWDEHRLRVGVGDQLSGWSEEGPQEKSLQNVCESLLINATAE